MQIHFIEKPKGFDLKMRIAHAITRPIGEMTVAQICEAAGISRQTFYSHFESKYTIGSWYAHYCDSFTLAEIGRTLTWQQGYEKWRSLVEEEKKLFGYSRKQKYVQEGLKTVAAKRYHDFKTTITTYRHLELTEDLDYLSWVCARLEGIVALEWFESDFTVSPEVMAKRIELCAPSMLHRALST